MNAGNLSGVDASAEISELIEALLAAEQRLELLTAGEIDSVAGRDGRVFLLRRAQDQLRHSETDKQAAILNALPAHIALLDTRGVIISVNEAWRRFANTNALHAPGHGIGLDYLDVCDRAEGDGSEMAHRVADGIRAVLGGTAKSFSVEYPCHSPLEQRWFQLTVTPLAADHPNGVVVMHVNITQRKHAESALAELSEKTGRRERMLTAALSSMHDFAQIYDRNGRFLFVNEPLLKLWGLPIEEVVGKDFFDLRYPQELAARLQRELAGVFAEKKPLTGETPYTSATGKAGFFEYIFSPIFAADGTVDFIVGSTRDISERKRTEAALRESEAHFRFLNELTEASGLLATLQEIMDVKTRMLGVHLRASRCAYADVGQDGDHFTILHDYTDGCPSVVGNYQLSSFGPRAVKALNAGETLVIHNVDNELWEEGGGEMFTAIGIKAIITCPLIKDGSLRAMMAVHQSTPRQWRPSEIALVQEVVRRCWVAMERRRAEEKLRQSEKRFKALFDQAAVGVAMTDASDGSFAQVNQRFCEMVGHTREELEQLTFADITYVKDAPHGLETMRQMKAGLVRESSDEKRYVRKDGSEVWASVTVSTMWAPGEKPDYFIAVALDITAQKKLEEQFRQAQKMEAIGTLAGGIAHDFNNILTAINGYTELARMILEGNPEVREHLGAVLQASSRAADLVRQILAFSRQEPMERRAIQLRPVIAESLKLLRATLPSTIEFTSSLAPNAPVVFADVTQIHQILMNLGTNAWHAMRERPGKLRVVLERCVVDELHAAMQSRLRPGVYARVTVSDTGSGMDAATLRRIFEPFFTTKPPGEGTGLGLSVVHGIMEGHDGTVTVYSQPGEGTVFHLYFPAHAGAVAPASDELGAVARGRGQHVLLVDDEELLVRLGGKTLTELGYVVETATQPAVALEMVRADPRRFSLVVTDQTMPGMTGLVLAKELQQIRPELPVILMTGYSLALTPERVKAAGVYRLLLKPATIHSLGTAAHAALSQTTSF